MVQVKKIKVDEDKVKIAIQTGLPLTVTTYTLPIEMEDYITDILTIFLKQLDQEILKDSLSYCVKELVTNAKKANTKRVYFNLRQLDINSKEDYDKGMVSFKADTLGNIKYYLEEQRKRGLYIKVLLQMRNNKIKIEIKNKAELTLYEYKRIHDKITRAQQYSSVEEGITQLLDDSEGAGLGLVIMFLILRKIGLTDDNYQIISENGETISRIIIPFNENQTSSLNELTKEFIAHIDGIPDFPENITKINQMIDDPEAKLSDIAMQISNDVSLTGELLKIVNSATYVLSSPCQSIPEAVKLLGLKGLKNLLFSIGSLKNLLADTNDASKKLWTHSYKVAFYSYNIARNFCANDRNCIDDSYVCGLLHDMGKVIFENTHPESMDIFKKLCEDKKVPLTLFESLIAGGNHGELGARIAEKWNFPQTLASVIRYHHEPDKAPDNVKKLSAIVYLADFMAHRDENLVDFAQINMSILETFGITSENQLEGISDKLCAAFAQDM